MYDDSSPILGQSPVDGDRIASFMLARPAGEYTEKDIRGVIVPAYLRTCGEVGVNALLAIAQMIHETGNLTSFWAARPRRNPAGIGVNGQTRPAQPPDAAGWAFDPSTQLWRFGVSFATWEQDAIVAHIGRLLAYTLPKGAESPAQAALIGRALAYRPLPDKMRGSAPSLRQLGKAHNPTGQGWASPGTEYGAKIAALASRMAQ
jgi:Mannosyl-glycoprotein endo-beta-N-acetylglucosaminidase